MTKTGETLAHALRNPDHNRPVDLVQLLGAPATRFSPQAEATRQEGIALLDSKHTHEARQGTVRVRELPGFIKVQDAAWIGDEDDIAAAAQQFVADNFGVLESDLAPFELSDDVEIDPLNLKAELARNPGKLLSHCLTDDEQVGYLMEMGFDLRDERQLPLRATRALAPAIEAVARGFAGHRPDPGAAGVVAFSERMQGEAKAFMRGRTR